MSNPKHIEREVSAAAAVGRFDSPSGRLARVTGLDDEPYRLSMTHGGGLEISARLRSLADAEKVIRAINAWKVLLTSMDEIQVAVGADGNFIAHG